ncbi:hypothetical protein BOX15_Mlig018069g1, partial [Macrostomum lignano]
NIKLAILHLSMSEQSRNSVQQDFVDGQLADPARLPPPLTQQLLAQQAASFNRWLMMSGGQAATAAASRLPLGCSPGQAWMAGSNWQQLAAAMAEIEFVRRVSSRLWWPLLPPLLEGPPSAVQLPSELSGSDQLVTSGFASATEPTVSFASRPHFDQQLPAAAASLHSSSSSTRNLQATHQLRQQQRRQQRQQFQCNRCSKVFSRCSSLCTHMLTHNGVKPFKCPFCDKRFHQKSDMKKHIFVHTGEKPYQCEACGRSFSQSSNLRTHRRRHCFRVDK